MKNLMMGTSVGAALAILAAVPPGAAFMAPGDTEAALEALMQERATLVEESAGLVASADQAGEDLGDDALARIDVIEGLVAGIDKKIKARKAVAAMNGPGQGRRTTPEPVNAPGRATNPGSPRAAEDPRLGFRSFGAFARAVRQAALQQDNADVQRLRAAATTYGSESVGADGGFAVPQEFQRAIWKKVTEEENLLNRTAQVETASNNMTFPKDETTPWQSSGGIQVYWESEAGVVTQSKPELKMETLRLAKLMGLVPVSDELLDDAPGLESWLMLTAPAKMAAKINTAIISGTGVGQPQGILNAGCTITVSKVATQPADSVWFANIVEMWSRMYAPCRRNAIWLINQDVEPQLLQMAFDPEATAGKVPVYLPANGASDTPYATLMGRPVVPVEACRTVGDKGDIILADLSQYMTLRKAGQDIRTDTSIHLFFDQALTAFRFMFRVNGQPRWGSSIAPQYGSRTRSCFVTLEARG